MSIQQKIYLKFFLSVAIIFAVAVFLFPYMSRDIAGISRNLKSGMNGFDLLPAKEAYLRDLLDDYALVKDNITFLRNSFLVGDTAVDFIKEIEEISLRTGNTEEIRITIPQIEKDGDLGYIEFQVFLYGSFDGLMDFLAELEDGRYQAAVVGLKITKAGKNDILYNQDLVAGIEAADIRSILDIRVYIL